MYRTHTCGELRKVNVGEKATLAGWVDSVRLHGRIGFIDLRDRYGITQVMFGKEYVETLKTLKKEFVVQIQGEVSERPKANEAISTGEIELHATSLKILSESEALPLELGNDTESTEETKLKYRFLDLRREYIQKNLMLRYKTLKAIRDFLETEKFIEIETPILAKSTPEGARDYLVPSRKNIGSFYALPQSPQLFKQLLMIAGYDRYFQIAKCFRDEDLRADRQPEFTQLDMEMSFIEEDDILALIERMMKYVFKKAMDIDLEIPFERIDYDAAMEKYNSDKPDLRASEEKFKFEWVTNFPMFEYSEEEKRYKAKHHPFTMPKGDDFSEPEKVKSYAYDLVLNGWELGGGSLRIHDIKTQIKVFEALGIEKKEAEEKFGFLLNAMKYGVPPLGGLACGVDRMIALMAGEDNIRNVIAFPKNKFAEDLMLEAPSEVSEKQLEELGIKINKK